MWTRRLLLVLLLVLPLAACGDKGTGPEEDDLFGTYELVEVNGDKTLPATIVEEPGYKQEVLSVSITIGSDGKWNRVGTFKTTSDGQVREVTSRINGTWTRSGNAVTFLYTFEGTQDDFTWTLEGNTLIDAGDGERWVYRKK